MTTLTTKDTKFITAATLSTQNNVKLFKQLEPGFKRTINWNKHQFKEENQPQNRHLDFLIDPSFQSVKRLILFYNLKMKIVERVTSDAILQM